MPLNEVNDVQHKHMYNYHSYQGTALHGTLGCRCFTVGPQQLMACKSIELLQTLPAKTFAPDRPRKWAQDANRSSDQCS